MYTSGDPFAVSLSYVVGELESVTPTQKNYDYHNINISPYPNALAYGHAACNLNLTAKSVLVLLKRPRSAHVRNVLGLAVCYMIVQSDMSNIYPFDDSKWKVGALVFHSPPPERLCKDVCVCGVPQLWITYESQNSPFSLIKSHFYFSHNFGL